MPFGAFLRPSRIPARTLPSRSPNRSSAPLRWRFLMLDIAYVIGGCIFFAVAMLYATACDNL
jgi:hypothetical protein